MFKAQITFSNNDKLILSEDQLIVPIKHYKHEGQILTSMCEPYKIWNHIHDGLIPSITELLCRCDFFRLIEYEKVYKVSAVVSIENL